MIRIALLSTAILVGLSATHAVQAAGNGPREAASFETLDADGDGGLTLEELRAYREGQAAERFEAADTNGDGLLDADEMRAAAEARDSDRRERRIQTMIERLDSDGDGALSQEELAEGRAQWGERRAERDGDRSGHRARTRGGERIFERFDADGDGALSAEEYANATERMNRRGHRSK